MPTIEDYVAKVQKLNPATEIIAGSPPLPDQLFNVQRQLYGEVDRLRNIISQMNTQRQVDLAIFRDIKSGTLDLGRVMIADEGVRLLPDELFANTGLDEASVTYTPSGTENGVPTA